MAVLVDLEGVGARTADRVLFAGLSLTVSTGDRLGVVGVNGTGKSTLLRVVAGAAPPETGTLRRGRGVTVGHLPQEADLPAGTVAAAVGSGWQAEAAIDRLGMAEQAATDVATLSGGQRKRVALAAVLAHPSDLLVLDEPTNHLDLAAVAWLEEQLAAFRGGLVIVSHDRHLLDRVTTRMLELDRGHSYVHEGGYASYLEAADERAAHSEAAEATRRNLARRELAWLRRGAPARTRKPQARIDAAKRIVEGRPEGPARRGDLDLSVQTPRLGDKVIELSGAGYRDVLHSVDLSLDSRERLAVVGPNGSGKTTLLDLLAGRRQVTSGEVEVGPTVAVGYYEQRGVELDGDARVRELVAGPSRVPGTPEDVALMERFWFGGELAFAPVRTLSGGERRRLQLLLVLAGRPNVLLLDEPTNDLDLDTLRILEDFLEEWPGALVVVSHDRTFLDRTSERVIAVQPGGAVAPVAGGLDAYLRSATARPVPAAPATTGAPAGRRLRELDKEMARCRRRLDQLATSMAASTDHEEMARLGTELAEAQAALAAAEEEWLVVAEAAESGQ